MHGAEKERRPGSEEKEKKVTQLKLRGLWLDKEMHDALKEYAYLHRTTMGDVVRAVLDQIRNSDGTIDSEVATGDRPGRSKLSIKASDEQWQGAASVAKRIDSPFHSLIRRYIIKALKEEGLL